MEDGITGRVRDYVKATFLYTRPDVELKDDDQLIGSGIIDSMGVMELIEFLESAFGIVVADEEITEQNLGSLSAIRDFVVSKGAVRAA